ncbi:NAD(P)H nitroreductase [Catellatospora sp. IY07-71]|uniref:Acg family FMN-binding oxidoreductase n=1 Tax=Catellatospora sp. IY07-71 TaxID=2728827 RepID=UPI001BB54539|nr:nitroreductase family protein [Catellatospora sp. IY07-71]BCJ75213.1 NAD(P)H nitroreductase [Catellatospora sp. IY07-71]
MATEHTDQAQPLRDAARTALAAPSVFNTQPWHWQTTGRKLLLRADRTRQLHGADPDGRMLTISCGVALHHARVALAATGHDTEVTLLPDPADPDLLAELAIVGPREPRLDELQQCAAIRHRRTDRRPFTSQPVPEPACHALVITGERQGAHVHLVAADQIPVLALAAVRAGALQLSDPEYRAELADWTHRPPWSGDGVPTATAVRAAPRRVPVRDYAPFGGETMRPGPDTDAGARYLMIYTDEDNPAAWLHAGQALSAILLTAQVDGLGSAPISDITEVGATRDDLRRLLPGLGHPQMCVRVGHARCGLPPPTARRSYEESVST